MADEQRAREQLSTEREKFATEAKASCMREATGVAGTRSYVELLICFQSARDAGNLLNE